MRIYTTLNRGEYHVNHCEDFLVNVQLGSDKRLVAVLDGCSMGTESAFASMLYGKILRNISKKKFYEEFAAASTKELKEDLKEVLKELFNEIKQAKNQLGLEIDELLSTVILGIINTATSEAEIMAIGDGLVFKDGEVIEYDQDNRPDYMAYHLAEDFETWFADQNQRLSISGFNDLSISTDGIFTFVNLKSIERQKSEGEIVHYLLADNEHDTYDNFLERKVRHLKEEFNHTVMDDLAIIRIKNTH